MKLLISIVAGVQFGAWQYDYRAGIWMVFVFYLALAFYEKPPLKDK